MHGNSFWGLLLIFGLVANGSHGAETADTSYFQKHVAPILINSCLECHGAEKKGDLDLRSRSAALKGGESGEVIVPGEPEESLLFEHVNTQEMPPKKPLPAAQIATLKKWISDGASYPAGSLDPFSQTTTDRAGYDWWSLRSLQKTTAPDVADAPVAWREGAIDRYIFKRLKAKGLQPSSPATPRILIRRATYDLSGLPPTPREVEAFVKACQVETGGPNEVGQKAYVQLLDRLLASPHYGEQWGRHWLDVVRFGESNGFERNVIIENIWPFRDYVIRSFNADKPFDQLVREHLAGDVVAGDDPLREVGTAFLVCGPYDNVGNRDPVQAAQIRADILDEMIRATGESFLGMTIGCARCHDHKFDPISQRDYYRMYATFAGVTHGAREFNPNQDPRRAEELAGALKEAARVENQLLMFQPLAFTGKTIVLDDEDAASDDPSERGTTLLQTKEGHGVNPPGVERGKRDDPGGVGRLPNLGRGRYVWWKDQPGVDLFCWNPATEGEFRVWLSWGCGWETHSPNAQYLLDVDGDLKTKQDQHLIATVNQRRFARGGFEKPPSMPLWSGFFDAGVHPFGPRTRVVLRGGDGEASTADVIVLQEVETTSPIDQQPALPTLRDALQPKKNIDRIRPTKARFIRFTVEATNSAEPCLDELEVFSIATEKQPARNVANASQGAKASSSGDYQGNPKHRLSHVHDGKYGNSRSWISNQAGQGWVQMELAQVEEIDRIVWGRDRERKYEDRLPTSYRIEVALEPGKWRLVASSEDRLAQSTRQSRGAFRSWYGLSKGEQQRAAPLQEELVGLQHKIGQLRRGEKTQNWWLGRFQQNNGPFHVFQGGSPQRKGTEVVAGSMGSISAVTKGYQMEAQSPEADRRRTLANWIVAKDNPLTARVMANRVWHYHFGQGIVDTPSDFGFMGGRPTHPQLLDFLASQLQSGDWRLKSLHKQIMLSQTYRQASTFRQASATVDGESRLLWRFPPRRLTSEEIRDTALAISGKLDTRMGGPGFRLYRYVQDNVATYHPLDVHDPATYRRAVYHQNARATQIDLMTEFDSPDCAFSTPRRSTTTSPLQALTLLNHRFTIDMSRFLTERIKRETAKEDRQQQIVHAFLLAFSRHPTPEEASAASVLVDKHGLAALCRALLNANEFVYVN